VLALAHVFYGYDLCFILIFTARSELRKVLFLALSVTFCLCMKYLGNRERICAKFTGKTCLVPRSEDVEGKGQRSKVKVTTEKRRFRRISREPLNGFALSSCGGRVWSLARTSYRPLAPITLPEFWKRQLNQILLMCDVPALQHVLRRIFRLTPPSRPIGPNNIRGV